MDNGFLQVDYTPKTKYNYDLTNKLTLNKSTNCFRLKEVKTKEYMIPTLAFPIFTSESKITE